MKKFFWLFLSVTLLFAGCTGENPDDEKEKEKENPAAENPYDLPKWDGTAIPAPSFSKENNFEFPIEAGTITISITGDSKIFYTAGDGDPDQLYTGAITITKNVTIKAAGKMWDDEEKAEVIGPVTTVNYTIVTNAAMDFVASMKMGWNLGNTLDGHNNLMPSETSWQNTVTTQKLMDGVAERGFGAVRIPVTWGKKLHGQLGNNPGSITLTVPQIEDLKIDAAWLNRTAEIVGYAKNAGLKAIINIHHDGANSRYWLSVKTDDLTGDNAVKVDAIFKTIWTQIAEKFKDEGDYLIFEGFNELHDGSWSNGNVAQRTRINELNKLFIDTVRAAGSKNSDRYLLIHGWVTRPEVTVSNLTIPEDTAENKIIVGVHFYDPHDFTGSAEQNVWGNTALPGNWANEGNVKYQLENVRDKFIKEKKIPVIIGEYGAVNQSGAAFAHRKYYMEYVTKYAFDCRLMPFYWDNAGFGTGSEKFGVLKRADGTAYDSSAQQIIDILIKASKDVYSLSSIAEPQ